MYVIILVPPVVFQTKVAHLCFCLVRIKMLLLTWMPSEGWSRALVNSFFGSQRGILGCHSLADENGQNWHVGHGGAYIPIQALCLLVYKDDWLTSIGGTQKGGFPKGGFGRCSPGTKTRTRVLVDVLPERTPERGYVRLFSWNENRNEGTFAKTTLYETALLSPGESIGNGK